MPLHNTIVEVHHPKRQITHFYHFHFSILPKLELSSQQILPRITPHIQEKQLLIVQPNNITDCHANSAGLALGMHGDAMCWNTNETARICIKCVQDKSLPHKHTQTSRRLCTYSQLHSSYCLPQAYQPFLSSFHKGSQEGIQPMWCENINL